MKHELSKERLKWIAADGDVVHGAIKAMARQLLAAHEHEHEQEPVADVVAWSHPNKERTCDVRLRRFDVAPGPLYAHPAPSIPAAVPEGYCMMPLKLSAENGAKGALSGEFHVTHRIVCQSCGGEGCEDCNEEGGWDGEILIGWDIIKQIHEAAVEACALPAATKGV